MAWMRRELAVLVFAAGILIGRSRLGLAVRPAKLPALAKSMGQSARVFKGEMKAMKDDDVADATAPSVAAERTSPAAPAAGTSSAPDSTP